MLETARVDLPGYKFTRFNNICIDNLHEIPGMHANKRNLGELIILHYTFSEEGGARRSITNLPEVNNIEYIPGIGEDEVYPALRRLKH